MRVVDPKEELRREIFENVVWYHDVYLAVQGSDLIVILTEWNEFRALDLKNIKKSRFLG